MQSWCRNRTARNSCPAPSCRGACLDLVVRTSDDSSREVSSAFQGLLVVLSLNQLEAHEGRDLSTKYLLLVLPAPQFSSVAQSCPALCDPMDCSMPGFPVHHQLLELAQTHAHRVGDAISHLLLCRPLLLLPSLFPSIRVFSNESVLRVRWPKDWSFRISPSNECSGLISFRIDWFDLPVVQRTLKNLL